MANLKTVEAIKYALRKHSHGGALGRHYVQKSLEHLKQCRDYFNSDVKEVKANVQTSSNHAFQRFIFENIPQLKYRNPQTVFACTIKDEIPTFLQINFVDGREVTIDTNQNQSEIYKNVVDVTKSTNELAKDIQD